MVILVAFLWSDFFKERESEIPVLYPLQQTCKTSPQVYTGFINHDKDKTIYENFNTGLKSSRSIKLLPEPEAPLLLRQNSNFNNDVFSRANGNFIEEISDKADDVYDPIWSSVDRAITDKEKDLLVEKPNKKVDTKSLQITNIDEKKSSNLNKKIEKKQYYYIQLAYTRSAVDCEKQWERIKILNKKILWKQQHKVTTHRKNELVFYQLLVGPFDQFKDAKQVCTKIKLEKQKCLVLKQ